MASDCRELARQRERHFVHGDRPGLSKSRHRPMFTSSHSAWRSHRVDQPSHLPQGLGRRRRRARPRRASEVSRSLRRRSRSRGAAPIERAAKAAQHSHPRRHGLHRPRAGRIRARARAQGHAAQSQQDAAGLLQGTRRAADRRSERRRERAQGQEVRRRDRQPDDGAGVGAQRRRST